MSPDVGLVLRRETAIIPEIVKYSCSRNHLSRSDSMTLRMILRIKRPPSLFCVPYQMIIKRIETALVTILSDQRSVDLGWSHPLVHTVRDAIHILTDTVSAYPVAITMLPAQLLRITLKIFMNGVSAHFQVLCRLAHGYTLSDIASDKFDPLQPVPFSFCQLCGKLFCFSRGQRLFFYRLTPETSFPQPPRQLLPEVLHSIFF